MFNKIIKNRQGTILPIVIASVVVIALIAVGVLVVQRANVSTTQTESQGIKTQNRAEYDVATAVLKFKADIAAAITDSNKLDSTSVVKRLILPKDSNTYRTSTNSLTGVTDAQVNVKDTQNNDVGYYVLKCYNDKDTVTYPYNRLLQFTGQFGTVTKIITHRLTLVPPGTNVGFGKYALFAGGSMSISNNATVNGSVAANGAIVNTGHVTGDVVPNFGLVGLTNILPSASSTLAFTKTSTYSGRPAPRTTSGAMTAGAYYKNGNYTLSNNKNITTTGIVTIFVNGNVNFDNNVIFNASSSGSFAILATGSITIGNNTALTRALVVGGGSYSFSNNATLTGAVVVGGSISIANNGFIYDADTYANYPDLFNFQVVPGGSGSGNPDWAVTDNGAI